MSYLINFKFSIITCVLPCTLPLFPIDKVMYLLLFSDDLPLGLILLAVNQRIHHKYTELLNIPLLNIEYDTLTSKEKLQ